MESPWSTQQQQQQQQPQFGQASGQPATSPAIFSVEVDAFLISCLNNPKDKPFVLAADEQLARLAMAPNPTVLSASPQYDSQGRPIFVPAAPILLQVNFPPLSSYHRRIVHRLADHYGLAHRVYDLDPSQQAQLPANTTSKYRNVQVLKLPQAQSRPPETLLRLRDLLPEADNPLPLGVLPSSASGLNGFHHSGGEPSYQSNQIPTSPSTVPQQAKLLKRGSPVMSRGAVDGNISETVVTEPMNGALSPQPPGPVRLLQRKPELKLASSPLPPHSLPPRESEVSSKTTDTIEAAPLADDYMQTLGTSIQYDSEEEEEEEHIDERLKSQLRIRKEEYAKARARIFGPEQRD